MLPEPVSVPSQRPDLLGAYAAHLERTGRQGTTPTAYLGGARSFLHRWPDVQRFAGEPLAVRLSANRHTRPFITFLMLEGELRPGYDYLVSRLLTSLWRELTPGTLSEDLSGFESAARALGFSAKVSHATASLVTARLLIQTGRRLGELVEADVDELTAVCVAQRAGKHYADHLRMARQVLFHLGILNEPPATPSRRFSFEERMADVAAQLRPSFVIYLERLTATCAPATISVRATHLAHFGRHLARIDPQLSSLAKLDRCRHIESYLAAIAQARSSRTGEPISAAERQHRVATLRQFLEDIARWGWPEAPARQLLFVSDLPRLPYVLPRYLTADTDRRLVGALEASQYRLEADALLLQRVCGLRIGELLDLELDCVHEAPGLGAWLKVPLGKLDSERMLPLDEETVALIDRITAERSPGRPLRHPRSGRLVEFLFTHHGKRLSPYALREELNRAGASVGLGHLFPHQLRHTYATTLVNAGCSLPALMALLGHVSATMSLRYGRLFDSTLRTEYERALALVKQRLGPVLPEATPVELNTDWRAAPLIKARLAGGYCLRSAAQGVCPYTHVCEFCPNFRSDAAFLPVLAAQRADTEVLVADAEQRGWGEEVARHRRLLERLDVLIARAQAG
jgi:integrase